MVATAAIAAPSFGAPGERQPQAITCEVHPRAHELAIHARELRLHPQLPDGIDLSDLPREARHDIRQQLHRVIRVDPELTIERRIDEITVVDNAPNPFASDGFYGLTDERDSVRSCGAPLVGTTNRISIETGKRTPSADLNLDLRYGALAPGLTDEGDGGSEIELDARLGSGYVQIEMSRYADSVTYDRPRSARATAPSSINLNAAEPVPDPDLVVGHNADVLIDGGAGDDRLTSSGASFGPQDELESGLEGGQGDDTLIGGSGSDVLYDGPGQDRFDTGAGIDAVLALGGRPDRIDCGPGLDVAVVFSKRSSVRHCEKVLDAKDLGLPTRSEVAIGVSKDLRKRLPRAAQRVLSRLTLSR